MGFFNNFAMWFRKNKNHFSKEQIAEIEKLLDQARAEVNDQINNVTNVATKKLENMMSRQNFALYDMISTSEQFCTSEIERIREEVGKVANHSGKCTEGHEKKIEKRHDEDNGKKLGSENEIILEMAKLLIKEKKENMPEWPPACIWNPCMHTPDNYEKWSAQRLPYFKPVSTLGCGCNPYPGSSIHGPGPILRQNQHLNCSCVSCLCNNCNSGYFKIHQQLSRRRTCGSSPSASNKRNWSGSPSSEKEIADTVKNFFLSYTNDYSKPGTSISNHLEEFNTEATDLRHLVEEFDGKSGLDEMYHYLNETLSNLLWKLNHMDASDNVKTQAREETIIHIETSLSLLRSKKYY